MSKQKEYLKCSRKYDLPLFCAGWTGSIASSETESDANPAGSSTERPDGDPGPVGVGGLGHVVIGGGGGELKNGVGNFLVLAHYDFGTNELSEAISTSSTDDNPPYRLAVHPGTNEIVCSVSEDCRLFELRSDDGLKLKSSEKMIQPLKGVGEQNCLSFSNDGTKFATGGEDGHLRVFEWPSLSLLLDEPNAHKSVKDLDFSLDSSLLASTGDSGPCRIWDISGSSAVTVLTTERGTDFGFCRFSRDGTNPILYVTLRTAGKGLIGLWDTRTWERVRTKRFSDVPISAFSISPDGKFLAIGSAEGDLSIVDAKKLRTTQRLKSAHMVFVTSMEFSPNSRALLSVSGDSSARVTAVPEPSKRAVLDAVIPACLIIATLYLILLSLVPARSRGFIFGSLGFTLTSTVLISTVLACSWALISRSWAPISRKGNLLSNIVSKSSNSASIVRKIQKGIIKFITGTSGHHEASPPPDVKLLNSSVWEFCSPPRPDVDIIFFHGLQLGDFEDAFWKTWLAKNDEQKVWPKDWLSKKLPNARIFSVSYNSSAIRPEGQFDMGLLGENLVSDIIDDKTINIGQNRPVFLVGHSLGGIVIKQFLLSAKLQFDRHKPEGNYQGSRNRITTFLENFQGVFYYATPHGGSEVAENKLTELVGKLMDTSPILGLLKTLDKKRQRINSSFSRHQQNMTHLRACAVAEGLDTNFKGFTARVVPEASAFQDFDIKYMHTTADHFTVCQASHENDPIVIGKLVQFIQGSNDEDLR